MKRLLLAFLLLFTLSALQAKEIIIYHTSDTHGHYFDSKNTNGKLQGGFAALASYIEKNSEKFPNYLLLDSGDFIQGDLEANKSKGQSSIGIYNTLGYNALTIGNHEFDFGTALDKITPKLKADVLVANFEGIKNSKPYKIYEVDGVKIAVIGIGLNGDRNKTYKELDTFASYKKAIEAAAKQNPDATILLIHASNHDLRKVTTPQQLVASTPYNVDVALGGHMHIIDIETVGSTLYVESGAYLENISQIELTFDDKTGKLTKTKAKTIPMLVSKTGQDAKVKALTDAVQNPLYDVEIASSKYSYNYEASKKGYLDTQLANFMTCLFKDEAQSMGAHIDFGLLNTKNLRSDIPKGPVLARNILTAIPYDNTLATTKISGQFLEDLIKGSLNKDFSLFQFCGAKVKAYFKGDTLDRLDITINGQPVIKDKIYDVATNSFIAIQNTYEAAPFKAVPAKDRHKYDKTIREILATGLNIANQKKPYIGNIKIIEKK
ncbi:MAG: bifunctional metallophosphatase/5'-nucleotidase [Elusimicrobiota bacterium]|jgi:2',3'-cyclic-nucleotide 2'-phosphodiesterase (5'-nucleotidase family)|nr:bifunctional metallophosphatase/5'-nucleotidase [Elusimicrobiota bacterium]